MLAGAALQPLQAQVQTIAPRCSEAGRVPCLQGETWRNVAAGGEVGTYTQYRYDKDGNRILRETFNSLPDDSTGRPVGNPWTYVGYEYEDGRLKRQIQVSLSDTVGTEVEYSYDARGNLAKTVTRTRNGPDMYQDLFTYDEPGDRLVEVRRLVANALVSFHRYAYDSLGRIQATTLYEKQGGDFLDVQRVATAYDSAGRALADSAWRRQAGEWYLISTVVRTFLGGLLASVARYERDGTDRRLMDSVAYAYDPQGNRIKEEGFDDESAPTYAIDFHWITTGIRPRGRPPAAFRLVPVGDGSRVEAPGTGPVALRLCDWRGAEIGRATLAPGATWRPGTRHLRSRGFTVLSQGGATRTVPFLP